MRVLLGGAGPQDVVQCDTSDIEKEVGALREDVFEGLVLPFEALILRFKLRSYQSLFATFLYFMSTKVRVFGSEAWQQLLFQVLTTPLLMFLYRHASLNRAGGYYNTFLEMFTELPQHADDFRRRVGNNAAYEAKISEEKTKGIFRNVNALETGIVSALLVAAPSWLLAEGVAHKSKVAAASSYGTFLWRALEALAFLCWHLAIQLNAVQYFGLRFLGNSLWGILQPEALWRFRFSRSGAFEGLETLTRHPEPSI